MSEERLERIENQLSQLLQGITVMQQDLGAMKQNQNALRDNQNALREDVVALRHRVDSVEGTLRIAISDGFRNHDLYLDDMNADLAANERQTRRLNRRVERLERNETT
jgi:FtsZ-binding cell division protein ZapB